MTKIKGECKPEEFQNKKTEKDIKMCFLTFKTFFQEWSGSLSIKTGRSILNTEQEDLKNRKSRNESTVIKIIT